MTNDPAIADVADGQRLEPVLPYVFPDRRRLVPKPVGLIALVLLVALLCAAWWVAHRHVMASFTIMMQGGGASIDFDGGKWKHGGETVVVLANGGDRDLDAFRLPDLHRVISLDLARQPTITPKSYGVFDRLPDLELLYLSRNPASYPAPATFGGDDLMPHLSGHLRLRELYLDGNQITDAGLSRLANLPSLEVLDLSRTRITDAGLKHLAKFPRLQQVHVDGTAVTPEGIAKFGALRTDVEVRREDLTPAGKIREIPAY